MGTTAESKASFEDRVRSTLATYLQTDVENIKDLSHERGSVVVSFTLVGYDENEKELLEEAYQDLRKVFQSGGVKIVSFKLLNFLHGILLVIIYLYKGLHIHNCN